MSDLLTGGAGRPCQRPRPAFSIGALTTTRRDLPVVVPRPGPRIHGIECFRPEVTANSKKFIRCESTPQTLVTEAVNSAQIHRLMKEQDVKGSLQTGSALKEEACFVFTELVDYLITDVATEAHRAARLGFDYRLNIEEEEDARLLAQARTAPGESTCSGAEINCKYTVDVFGQSHPVLASEVFDCMNCGRSIVAGRFAPHLEKCMGKGRRTRLKNAKSTSSFVPQQKRARGSPGSSHGTSSYSQGVTGSRSHSKVQMTKEVSQSAAELNDETSDEVHDDEDKVRRSRLPAGHCQVSA